MVNEIRLEHRNVTYEREEMIMFSRFSTGGEGVEPGRSGAHSKNQVEDVSKSSLCLFILPILLSS